LVAYNHETGRLDKIAPAEAIGRLVPVIKQQESFGDNYTRDLGWWYGAFVSDGWTDRNRSVGYAKLDTSKRREFERIAREEISENFICHEYADDPIRSKNKLGRSIKIHLNRTELPRRIFKCVDDTNGANATGGRTALRKRLPAEILYDGSRECLLGLLAGLLEGDGSVGWNRSCGMRRAFIRFDTSSKQLTHDIQVLGSKLGFRITIVTTPPRGFSNTAYNVCLSIPDMHRIFPEMRFASEAANEFQQEFCRIGSPNEGQSEQNGFTDFTGGKLIFHVPMVSRRIRQNYIVRRFLMEFY